MFVIRHHRISTDTNGEYRRQLFDLIHDLLFPISVAIARRVIITAQESAAYTAVSAVVVRRIREAEQDLAA